MDYITLPEELKPYNIPPPYYSTVYKKIRKSMPHTVAQKKAISICIDRATKKPFKDTYKQEEIDTKSLLQILLG